MPFNPNSESHSSNQDKISEKVANIPFHSKVSQKGRIPEKELMLFSRIFDKNLSKS